MQFNLSNFLQWKINIFFYRKLGWNLAFWYIIIIGKIYFLIRRNEREKIRKVVFHVLCFHNSMTKKSAMTRRIFCGIFWHYYEKVFNVYSCVEKLNKFFSHHIDSKGISILEEGLAQGKGVLLVTGHFGGIEFIPTFLASQKYPITILVKFGTEQLRKKSHKLADKMSFKIIDIENCPNVINAIVEDLKSNRIVITQCDEIECWKPSLKDRISFLGKDFHLDRTINTLIKRGKCTLVFAVMKRIDRRRYQFIANSLDDIKDAFGRPHNKTMGELVLKYLERYIYRYPEEWYQWKKISEFEDNPPPILSDKKGEPKLWLKPAFEKIIS